MLKSSKVKVTRGQKPQKLPHTWRTCLLTGGRSSAGGSGSDHKLGLTIVRPNLLSTPETLGNWTDGRISFFLFCIEAGYTTVQNCGHTLHLYTKMKFTAISLMDLAAEK